MGYGGGGMFGEVNSFPLVNNVKVATSKSIMILTSIKFSPLAGLFVAHAYTNYIMFA